MSNDFKPSKPNFGTNKVEQHVVNAQLEHQSQNSKTKHAKAKETVKEVQGSASNTGSTRGAKKMPDFLKIIFAALAVTVGVTAGMAVYQRNQDIKRAASQTQIEVSTEASTESSSIASTEDYISTGQRLYNMHKDELTCDESTFSTEFSKLRESGMNQGAALQSLMDKYGNVITDKDVAEFNSAIDTPDTDTTESTEEATTETTENNVEPEDTTVETTESELEPVKPDYEVVAADHSEMYATTTVNIRSLPTVDSKKLGTLSANQKVTITGEVYSYKGVASAFYEITYNNSKGYVSAAYLTPNKPVVKKQTTSNNKSNSSSSVSNSAQPDQNTQPAQNTQPDPSTSTGSQKDINSMSDEEFANLVGGETGELPFDAEAAQRANAGDNGGYNFTLE